MPTTRSGSARSQAQRLAGGRPNRTFSIPLYVDETIGRFSRLLKLSRSQFVALAALRLATDPDAKKAAESYLAEEKRRDT